MTFATVTQVRDIITSFPELDFDDGHILVYGLADPRDGTVRYVGVTNNRGDRLARHERAKCSNRGLRDWLEALRGAALRPRMVTLGIASWSTWQKAEKAWIAFLRSKWELYNLAPGGVWKPKRLRQEAKPKTRRWPKPQRNSQRTSRGLSHRKLGGGLP